MTSVVAAEVSQEAVNARSSQESALARADQESVQTAANRESVPPQVSSSRVHKANGIQKLLGLSGVTMALALPIGIYPRVMQNQELDRTHEKIVQQLPPVTVAHVALAAPTRQISLPGSVEAIVDTSIYARTNGYVKERYADIGDRVTQGQLLADIETPEVDAGVKETRALVLTNVATKAQMQANLDTAKANLDAAVSDLAQAKANLVERQSAEQFAQVSNVRWKSLVQQGAVATQDADEKETAYKTSRAATAAAEEKVHSTQSQVVAAQARINAERANVNVSDANIDAARARQTRSTNEQSFNKLVAPFAGIITERNVDRGTLVSSGSVTSNVALYRLSRIDTVKVFVDVPQYAAGDIKVGQPVSITLKEFPGRTFVGKIERTSVALDANARTMKTEIHVPNADLRLVPGMYTDVSFSLPRAAHTFLIPSNSLLNRAEGSQVVVVSGHSIHYRNVQIGDDLGKQVEVLSGLTASDTVVVNPKDSLVDGALVSVEQQ